MCLLMIKPVTSTLIALLLQEVLSYPSSFTLVFRGISAVNQVEAKFAVVCLEEFSRCTELLAKPRSNRRRRPHHTHTHSVEHYGPQLAGTGPLICVYTKLMGQIRGELYSNSCRLGCNTVVNPAKLISSVPERQPFAFQSQCGNNLAV